MLAIFKREFKSYFQNVIGWLFVAALLAVYGLYFYVYNLKNGYPYISYDLKGNRFYYDDCSANSHDEIAF